MKDTKDRLSCEGRSFFIRQSDPFEAELMYGAVIRRLASTDCDRFAIGYHKFGGFAAGCEKVICGFVAKFRCW